MGKCVGVWGRCRECGEVWGRCGRVYWVSVEREREIYFAIHSLHDITKYKKGKNSSKQMARKHRLTARFSNQDAS